MKVQTNMKIANDLNSSVSFEHIVANEEETKEFGKQDAILFAAYMEGFGDETS